MHAWHALFIVFFYYIIYDFPPPHTTTSHNNRHFSYKNNHPSQMMQDAKGDLPPPSVDDDTEGIIILLRKPRYAIRIYIFILWQLSRCLAAILYIGNNINKTIKPFTIIKCYSCLSILIIHCAILLFSIFIFSYHFFS